MSSRSRFGSTVLLAGHERGVTLLELLVVVIIVAILAALALPSLADLTASGRIRSCATDLMSSLLLARSEAIKRNAQVSVQPAGSWAQGWTVETVSSAEQLDRKNALGYRVEVDFAPGNVVYDHNGRLTAAARVSIQLTDALGRTSPRCVHIDVSGLPQMRAGACS